MLERFIPINFLGKILSPYPAYIFLNLGFHPDSITITSLLFILIGSLFLILGYGTIGVIFYLCFFIFDSVDGDMARCVGPTKYGGILDSFGADLFYACSSASIGWYLFINKVSLFDIFLPHHFVLIGAFTSASFLIYRLITFKLELYKKNINYCSNNHEEANKKNRAALGISDFVYKIGKLYRHILLRGNFFSEAGMIFWFSLLVLLGQLEILGTYLLIILIYNFGYLFMNYYTACSFFKNSEN